MLGENLLESLWYHFTQQVRTEIIHDAQTTYSGNDISILAQKTNSQNIKFRVENMLGI